MVGFGLYADSTCMIPVESVHIPEYAGSPPWDRSRQPVRSEKRSVVLTSSQNGQAVSTYPKKNTSGALLVAEPLSYSLASREMEDCALVGVEICTSEVEPHRTRRVSGAPLKEAIFLDEAPLVAPGTVSSPSTLSSEEVGFSGNNLDSNFLFF